MKRFLIALSIVAAVLLVAGGVLLLIVGHACATFVGASGSH